MDEADAFELEQLNRAFADVPIPDQFGDPSHCKECEEANVALMDRREEDLDPEELAEPSMDWFYSWKGDAGFVYFLPKVCHAALKRPDLCMTVLLDWLTDHEVEILSQNQREALVGFLSYIKKRNYIDDPKGRAHLESKINLLNRPPA